MLELAVALQVVLSASEVPEEIAPVHEVNLIGKEESEVGPLAGQCAVDEFFGRTGIAIAVAINLHRIVGMAEGGEESLILVGVFGIDT